MLSGIPLDSSQFISPFSGIHLLKNDVNTSWDVGALRHVEKVALSSCNEMLQRGHACNVKDDFTFLGFGCLENGSL